MLNNRQMSGFTLLELLIVIAIIGILAAVLVPNLIQARRRAHDRATQSYVYQVVIGVEANRDNLTYSIPPMNPCAFFTSLPSDPPSVVQCRYEPDPAAQSYQIFAESASGQVFQFNGSAIVLAASFP